METTLVHAYEKAGFSTEQALNLIYGGESDALIDDMILRWPKLSYEDEPNVKAATAAAEADRDKAELDAFMARVKSGQFEKDIGNISDKGKADVESYEQAPIEGEYGPRAQAQIQIVDLSDEKYTVKLTPEVFKQIQDKAFKVDSDNVPIIHLPREYRDLSTKKKYSKLGQADILTAQNAKRLRNVAQRLFKDHGHLIAMKDASLWNSEKKKFVGTPHHKSHKLGRDVDLALYAKGMSGPAVKTVRYNKKDAAKYGASVGDYQGGSFIRFEPNGRSANGKYTFDTLRTLRLIRAINADAHSGMQKTGKVEIFLNKGLIRLLNQEAAQQNISEKERKQLFGRAGTGGSVVKADNKEHKEHIHVRWL